MSFKGYEVLETSIGPLISDSRTSVYDVLQTLQEGEDFYAICVIHNLKPLQTEIALEYIEQNREQLEAELPALLEKKAEYERYHRAIAAERKKRPVKMTPLRKAFIELQEKNRHRKRDINGTSDT